MASWKPYFKNVESEIIRRLRLDSRMTDYRPSKVYTAMSDEPPRTMPALFVVSGRATPRDFTSNEDHVQFEFTIQYVDKHRNIMDAQQHSEDVAFAIQETLNETLDDRFLVTPDDTRLADGPNGLQIQDLDWGAVSTDTQDVFVAVEMPLVVNVIVPVE